jgi:hypothetical protein
MKYGIDTLTNAKIVKIIHNPKKEDIEFIIMRPDELSPDSISEYKKNLEVIRTKQAILWRDILELIELVGLNKILMLKKEYLQEIKEHLKVVYLGQKANFYVAYKNIPLYIIDAPYTLRPLFNMYKYYIIDYKKAKEGILKNLKEKNLSPDGFETIKKYLDSNVTINLDVIKIPYQSWISFEDSEHSSMLENIIDFNKSAILEELNEIKDDEPITIRTNFDNYTLIEKMSCIYPDVKHKGLRTFFENVNKNGLFMGIYLTDISIPNIEFKIIDEYLKPRQALDTIIDVKNKYFEYHAERLTKQIETNNFGDVVVDDNGNILEINPLNGRMESVLKSTSTKKHKQIIEMSMEMYNNWRSIINWDLPLP